MAEEQIVNPSTALDNMIEAANAPEEATETPAEEQPVEEIDSSVEEPQEESPEEEAEEPEIETIFLNDFAKDVEVDVADVYELSVKMPDEMEPTTISELKNFKIANHDIDQIRQELKNLSKDHILHAHLCNHFHMKNRIQPANPKHLK